VQKTVKSFTLTLSTLFFLNFFALGQVDSTEKALTYNPIIITSNKIATKLSNTISSVAVLNNRQIKYNSSRSVPEMLMGMPGVWMQKTGHAGGSPFIRGLTGNQILQMIDGIRLNNATFRYGPNQYLSTIDPFAVQQVETVKSAFSTLYGSDAIGGVVNILLKDPSFADSTTSLHGSVSGKTISNNMEYTGNLSLNYKSKNIAWDLISTTSTFGDILAANHILLTPTSYNQQSLHTKLKTNLFNKIGLTLCFQQLVQKDVDLFDQVSLKGFSTNLISPQKRQLSYAKFETKLNSIFADNIRFTASHQVSDEGRFKRKKGSVVLTHEFDQVITNGFQLETDKSITKNWKIITGIDIYNDNVRSEAADINDTSKLVTTKRGLYATGSKMNSYSIYHQQEIQKSKFTFQFGGRLSSYGIQINDAKFGDVQFNTPALTGNIGTTFHLNKSWNINAAISGSYRSPNISDLSSFGKFDYGTETPTPDLKPERSLNKEITIRKISNNLLFSISGFHNELTNLIDRAKSSYLGDTLYLGDRVYQKINIGKSYIYGAESELSFWATKSLNLASHLTYTFGQNLSAKEPMRRIPPFFGKVSGQYYFNKKLYTGIDWQFAAAQKRLAAGDKADHRINPLGTPGWGVINLKTGISFGNIVINAGIENILDQSYRLHGSGIDGYGRMAWVRLQVAF